MSYLIVELFSQEIRYFHGNNTSKNLEISTLGGNRFGGVLKNRLKGSKCGIVF